MQQFVAILLTYLILSVYTTRATIRRIRTLRNLLFSAKFQYNSWQTLCVGKHMSEMLANHYFLVRNFISAKPIYENIVEKDHLNKSIKKKLTICYITTGEVEKAKNLFLSQIKDDIEFIINTDINSEDCPCPEIVSEIENHEKLFKSESDKLIALGILWLYCSLEKSIELFKKAELKYPADEKLKEINSILFARQLSSKQNTIH